MAAPIGNQFWKLRSKHGRDKLFTTPEMLWEAACEYFEWCDENPFLEAEQAKSKAVPHVDDDGNVTYPPNIVELPKMRPYTIQGLCLYLDCNTMYFNRFEQSVDEKDDQLSKDFSLICSRIREIIHNQKYSGAASGFFNANIIARDLGLTDKTEVNNKGQSAPMIVINAPAGLEVNFPSNTDAEE